MLAHRLPTITQLGDVVQHAARASQIAVAGMEQRHAVAHGGIAQQLAVDQAVFQTGGSVAECADQAVEAAQIVVDDGLAGERNDAAVCHHLVGLACILQRAIGEFTVLIRLQQVGSARQLHHVHALEVCGVRCTAGPDRIRGARLFVCRAQATGRHVGQQVCEIAGALHACRPDLQHAFGDFHAGHATGVSTCALDHVPAQLKQAVTTVLAAVVRQRGRGIDTVHQRLLQTGHAGFALVAHVLDAGVLVATGCCIAHGQFVQHSGAGGLYRPTSTDQAAGQVGNAMALAEVRDVRSAGINNRGGRCGCGSHGCGGRGWRGGAACGVQVLRHGTSSFFG